MYTYEFRCSHERDGCYVSEGDVCVYVLYVGCLWLYMSVSLCMRAGVYVYVRVCMCVCVFV